MNAALAGQLTVVVILLGWYPAYQFLRPLFIRRRLRRIVKAWNAYTRERDHALALQIDKAWDRQFGRAQLVKAVRADLGLEDEDSFQQRARKAEGLGFRDPADDGWAA